MIHYPAGAGMMKNDAPKKYAIAVLIGLLLGCAYAIAEQRPQPQAQVTLPKLPKLPTVQRHVTKTLRAGDDCGARMEAVCTWTI